MGESLERQLPEQGAVLQPTFNGSIRIEARRERLTGDAGAILLREIMERVDLIPWLAQRLQDPRRPTMVIHPLQELLRTELTMLALGWTNADDADLLRHDPALRLAVSERKQDGPLRTPSEEAMVPDGLASQPTISRLLATLSQERNLTVLAEANLLLAQQRCAWLGPRQRLPDITLDIDSLPLKVHGQQAGSAYNGYFHIRCYHPLIFGSADTHELFGACLRQGNVHTANGLEQQLPTYLDWVHTHVADQVTIRGDAGFPSDALLTDLEQRQPRPSYVFRIKSYPPLKAATQHLVVAYQEDFKQRPQELREQEFRCHELCYKGDQWSRHRRVVLVIVPPEDGDLFARSFFLITSFDQTMTGPLLVDLYRERGTYEQMLGEFKSTLTPQLSSTVRTKTHYRGQEPSQRYPCRDAFATNQAILCLNLLAYNLLSLTALLHERAHRRHGRPKIFGRSSQRLSPKTVRQLYLNVPARVTLHGRRVWVSISQRAADHWQCLWSFLDRVGAAPVIG
ncbi:MAG: IS1380 family transposase [bacterium]|nr:IS1380 family transposase [bacterium]